MSDPCRQVRGSFTTAHGAQVIVRTSINHHSEKRPTPGESVEDAAHSGGGTAPGEHDSTRWWSASLHTLTPPTQILWAGPRR